MREVDSREVRQNSAKIEILEIRRDEFVENLLAGETQTKRLQCLKSSGALIKNHVSWRQIDTRKRLLEVVAELRLLERHLGRTRWIAECAHKPERRVTGLVSLRLSHALDHRSS